MLPFESRRLARVPRKQPAPWDFVAEWAEWGLVEMRPYLARHLEFARWCEERNRG